MSADRIADLLEFVRDNLGTVFDEARDQINEALTATVEDAKDQDKPAVLSLSINVKWNLDGNSVVLSMPVSVRRKYEASGSLDDPNQPKLPGVEGGQQ